MTFSLIPWAITDKLTSLRPQWLKLQGISLLMLDFDNTIVPYTTNVPTEEMVAWLREMGDTEIKLCVVSNSRNDRVKDFCREYGLDCITRAGKPGTRGIRECLRKYGVPAEKAALVGDQIYTDTLGGNLSGVRTILVRSIHNHNLLLKARHVAELPFIYLGRKRRIRL